MPKGIWFALLIVGSMFASASESRAADPGYCAQYARLAVHEFNANVGTPGCFRGADRRWNPDYSMHYGWCLSASYQAVAAERDYRRMRIHQCRERAY